MKDSMNMKRQIAAQLHSVNLHLYSNDRRTDDGQTDRQTDRRTQLVEHKDDR